jgi:hypothetical protein
LACFDPFLGLFWAVLGLFWPHSGRFLVILTRFWPFFGLFFAGTPGGYPTLCPRFCSFLGYFGLFWGCFGLILVVLPLFWAALCLFSSHFVVKKAQWQETSQINASSRRNLSVSCH